MSIVEKSSALWLWAEVVVPVLISTTIWTNRTRREMVELVIIQGGYMLVMFTIIGYAVHIWG